MGVPWPAVPRSLDPMSLARWLLDLEKWGKDSLRRLTSLDEAEVHGISGPAVAGTPVTILPSWDLVEYTGAGGDTLAVPSAGRIPGVRSRALEVLHNGAADTTVTLAAQGGETIDGQASILLYAGSKVYLRSNGATKWTSGPGLINWLTSAVSPIVRIGNIVAVAQGNLIAIGRAVSPSGNANVLIGDVRKGTGQDNVVIGHGNVPPSGVIGDSFNDNTIVGKDALVGGCGASVERNVLFTNGGSIVAGVSNSTGVGFGVSLGHKGAFVVGSEGTTDADDKGRFFAGQTGAAVVVAELVKSVASGSTALALRVNVGAGAVLLPVTLAASVGGQRALQVAG